MWFLWSVIVFFFAISVSIPHPGLGHLMCNKYTDVFFLLQSQLCLDNETFAEAMKIYMESKGALTNMSAIGSTMVVLLFVLYFVKLAEL